VRLVLGEFAGVLLASQRVLPRRAQSVAVPLRIRA